VAAAHHRFTHAINGILTDAVKGIFTSGGAGVGVGVGTGVLTGGDGGPPETVMVMYDPTGTRVPAAGSTPVTTPTGADGCLTVRMTKPRSGTRLPCIEFCQRLPTRSGTATSGAGAGAGLDPGVTGPGSVTRSGVWGGSEVSAGAGGGSTCASEVGSGVGAGVVDRIGSGAGLGVADGSGEDADGSDGGALVGAAAGGLVDDLAGPAAESGRPAPNGSKTTTAATDTKTSRPTAPQISPISLWRRFLAAASGSTYCSTNA
jgi:hypothetical protein